MQDQNPYESLREWLQVCHIDYKVSLKLQYTEGNKSTTGAPMKSCQQSSQESPQAEGLSASVEHVIVNVRAENISEKVDVLSVEEPVEIHVGACVDGQYSIQSVAVTMRTPGSDRELACGFLFTEGIISSPDDIAEVINDKCNVVIVSLKPGVVLDPKLFERHSFVASSCGVCGKKSIAAVRVKSKHTAVLDEPKFEMSTINGLSETMRRSQDSFSSTGGIHASALFDMSGNLIDLREDVGRHNALDKVIGAQFLQGKLPLDQTILMVSGRASFELVQKAGHAGIPILAAVGAPSSLAVSLAEESGMTLLGFVRDGRFNIYSNPGRMLS